MLDRIIVLENLRNFIRLVDTEFPVFILSAEVIKEVDGIVFADGLCLDDKNAKGDTLGIRRLHSSYPNMYELTKAIHDIPSLMKISSKKFIDSKGHIFNYEKTRFVPLVYHKIIKIVRKEIATIVWLEDINSPFTIPRPPDPQMKWAGVLYNRTPWLIYEFSEAKKKTTKRKV